MKRILSILMAIMVCVALACPVFAADTFVPSISYKDNPEFIPNEDGSWGWIMDGNNEITVSIPQECLIITPVSEATTSTKIPEAARQQLLDVYAKLTDGSMKIPYGDLKESLKNKDMVIRDLFDVTLLCETRTLLRSHTPEDCAAAVAAMEAGGTLRVTLDPAVNADTDVTVTVYKNGVWTYVAATNNGDGTLTMDLPSTGVVAFSVPVGTNLPPTQTGDNSHLVLWGVMLAVSAAALVVLLVSRRSLVQN